MSPQPSGLLVANGQANLEPLRGRIGFVVVAGSTRTSTIPGISIAGPSPEATLYTPTLDTEYLIAGRPITLDVIPVAPNGVPTPALITRAVLEALGITTLVVDAGCAHQPRIPHIALPSRTPGGRIDREQALPSGTSRSLYEEAAILGRSLARGLDALVVAETMPGGTTTAAAILEALGYRGVDRVSSSAPDNPRSLKKRVVAEALERRRRPATVFDTLDDVGDPVHVVAAGIAAGAATTGTPVYLGGGTQMAAVLAILVRLGATPLPQAVLTTRWVVEDPSADMVGLVSEIARVPVVAANVSFSGSGVPGLELYDKGYAKEGVGAGAALVTGLVRGLEPADIVRLVVDEYRRVRGEAGAG